jgi:hypothetical protein
MICHVIINDFQIGQRILYVLDETDFRTQKAHWHETDETLSALQNNSLFVGRLRWSDLGVEHLHVLIVNMLKMLSGMDDTVRENKESEPVMRLAFLLCGMISLLQQRSQSMIELFRVNRVSEEDVVYDYCATLDLSRCAPHELKIVIDNETT